MSSIVDDIVYYLFSVVEFGGLCVLTLSLFRLDLRWHIKEIIATSALCSLISLFLNSFNIHGQALILQVIGFILCFRFIFGLPITKAVVVGSFGYVAFLLIQHIFLVIISSYQIIDVTKIALDSNLTHVLQVVSVLITLVISLFILKANEGFGFLSDLLYRQRHMKNKVFVIVSVIFVISVAVVFDMFTTNHQLLFFFIILIVLIAVCSIMAAYFVIRDSNQFKIKK